MPFFDRIGHKMNMMEQAIDIPQQDVITKDNATVTVDGLAFYQVIDAAKASYEITNLDQAIVKLTMTNIRSVMGSMDLDQMLSHRDEINERLLRVVDAAVGPWGVKVNRIEIKDIVPPANLVQSMGRQMQAEREKRAEILQAEGQRQSAILKAEGQKQSQILEAEGRREAAFRDAEARERLAQAEAKATEMVSEAVARGDVASLNYFVAQKYLEAFGKLAQSPNQKVLIIPMEAIERARLARRHRRDRQGDVRPRRLGRFRRRRRQDRAGDAAQAERSGRLHHARLYAAGLSEQRHADRISDRARKMELADSGRACSFVIELVAPGTFMLWLGLSALLVGIISLLRRLAVAVSARRLRGVRARLDPAVAAFRAPRRESGDQPFLNRRADAFVGREFTLEKPIVSGNGTVRIDDTIWRLSGPGLAPAAAASRSCARDAATDAGGGGRSDATPRRRAADRADARCRPACRPRPRSPR